MSEHLDLLEPAATPRDAAPGLLRRLRRRPLALASLAFLVAAALGAVLAPVVAPYSPNTVDLAHVNAGPSGSHLLGTDDLGRDVLTRLLYGGRVTLLGTVTAVATACVVGVSAGLVAGYFGGWFDRAISRTTDMVMAIPGIIILLVVLSVFGRNETVAMVTFGILIAPLLVRIVRGSTLSVRNELFVDAARVNGLTRRQIMLRHILPRISGAVMVGVSLIAAGTVLVETGLGFLGLGVPPPTPSWGSVVATASQNIYTNSWLLVPAGLTVALSVLSFGLLGDAVRDASAAAWQGSDRPRRKRGTTRESTRPTSAVLASPQALLSVRNLVVELPRPGGPLRVVDGVSFDIAQGETVGIVGESGCGKTMTARALLGLVPAGGRVAGGECWFDGRDLTRLDERALRDLRGSEIALVSQDAIASLDPVFRVESQLGELVRIREPGLSRKAVRERVLELLDIVKLPNPDVVARRYPHELSGGMAQRVCIAAALAGRPRLLIADEPTTALDVTIQAEILDLLDQLQQQAGMAILLITHDWGVVADLCQRTIVMYAGQVVEEAVVERIFARPLHPYTKGLLHSSPQLGSNRKPLVAIPGTIPPPERWPQACRFHPRCTYATAECQVAAIPLVEPEAERLARCIHADELRAEAVAP